MEPDVSCTYNVDGPSFLACRLVPNISMEMSYEVTASDHTGIRLVI